MVHSAVMFSDSGTARSLHTRGQRSNSSTNRELAGCVVCFLAVMHPGAPTVELYTYSSSTVTLVFAPQPSRGARAIDWRTTALYYCVQHVPRQSPSAAPAALLLASAQVAGSVVSLTPPPAEQAARMARATLLLLP